MSGVVHPLHFSHNYAALTPLRSPRSESLAIELLSFTPEIHEPPTCKRHEDITILWVQALLPWVGHFILITGITAAIFFYIDNQLFNISLRAPSVTQFDGSISHIASRPLQSDITTALSIAVTCMRTAAAMWTAATTWRCVFLLMEEMGLSLQAIKRMTKFGLPAKPETWRGVIVAIILLAALPSQLSSPILTGSITWEPALKLVQGSQPAVNISLSSNGQSWNLYKQWSDNVETVILIATGTADTAWRNSNDDKATMKRLLRSTQNLPINSTLNNVTLPYFTVDAFQWIKDPDSTLNEHEKLQFGLPGGSPPMVSASLTMGLIPDVRWGPSSNTTFPSPATVSETRTLAILHSHAATSHPHVAPNDSCTTSGFFGGLPADVSLYQFIYKNNGYFKMCIAFARVTYTAGVGICAKACRLSALTVVQNDTVIVVESDAMTVDALAIMPRLLTYMGLGGASVPPPTNITDYTIRVLPRAYGAAWTALTDMFAPSAMLKTDVMIPVLMSRAQVSHWRVYVWLALNLLLTLSGLLFIFVQRRGQKPLVVDVAIAALLLDTSRVLANDQHGLCDLSQLTEEDSKIGPLRLQEEYGHRYVEVGN
jgi:hypothetical protein